MIRVLLLGWCALLALAAEPGVGLPLVWTDPALRRVEVLPGGTVTMTVLVRSLAVGQVVAVTTDCRCVEVVTPCPVPMAPDRPVRLDLRVHGVLPGLKTVSVRTSAGTAELSVQVVADGLGTGDQVLAGLPTLPPGGRRWVLVHDVGDALRNCGCTGGSLGGVDRIAGLGRALPGARLVLTGIVGEDARRLLTPEGWAIGDPGILVAPPDLMDALTTPGVVAVLAAQGPEHQRRITPPPAGGLLAVVLDEDADGRPVGRHLVPIDQSLPAVASVTAAVPRRRTLSVVEDAAAGAGSCQGCHPAAAQVWAASGHARPWAGLPEEDRVDACLPCHITPRPEQTAVAGVGCVSCHVGAEAHARQPTVRPPAARSCQDCHDAKHDPGFDRETAWERIRH